MGRYHWITHAPPVESNVSTAHKQCNENKQSFNWRHNTGVETIYRLQPIAWCCSFHTNSQKCCEFFPAIIWKYAWRYRAELYWSTLCLGGMSAPDSQCFNCSKINKENNGTWQNFHFSRFASATLEIFRHPCSVWPIYEQLNFQNYKFKRYMPLLKIHYNSYFLLLQFKTNLKLQEKVIVKWYCFKARVSFEMTYIPNSAF